MPTNYNGDGTIPSFAGRTPLTISSITNATPPVVTTSTNHGYGTGDTVGVYASGISAYNKLWTITVLTTNTFSLNNGTASGAATTGQCVDYSIRPLTQIISDGDVLNGANLNPAPESAINSLTFVSYNLSRYKLIETKFSNNGSLFNQFSATGLTTGFADLGVPALTSARAIQTNDILVLACTATVALTGNQWAGVMFALNVAGAGAAAQPTTATSYAPSNSGVTVPMTLRAMYTYAGTGGTVAVTVQGTANANTPTLTLYGPVQLQMQIYRPNW